MRKWHSCCWLPRKVATIICCVEGLVAWLSQEPAPKAKSTGLPSLRNTAHCMFILAKILNTFVRQTVSMILSTCGN